MIGGGLDAPFRVSLKPIALTSRDSNVGDFSRLAMGPHESGDPERCR
jgi:hypothetical protein